ncbi:N5-glutamine methyltransferase family protein [Paenibacillus daejeonensis]|uniref:N5-glutamine methyltransferase family protein n=1 Tax=Paenibacillus daejeonensis TaxID=135193 RepID=UPI00036F7729|nr:HemK/PrmC family methyltransferase [Paenibacillus daejeonensis]
MQEKQDTSSALVYSAGLTLREACLQASSLLEGVGVGEARANSELLLLHLLGIERAQLLRDWREPLPAEQWETWRELIRRKAAGEPVQYIMGEGWFYGRAFAVAPAVLIPRPETELLVEAVLEEADQLWPMASGATVSSSDVGAVAGRAPAVGGEVARPAGFASDAAARQNGDGPTGKILSKSDDAQVVRKAGDSATVNETSPTVLDIGTGSGAIALTLAAERPAWHVYASDLSTDALAVARSNSVSLGVEERVTFVQGDLLAPFMRQEEASGAASSVAGLSADIVVSNPPYIPAGDLPHLQREVRDYEPRLALDGGDDGLDPYRRMVQQLEGLSQLPRIVAFELGMGQAREVARLLEERFTWSKVRIIEDYAGIERHVVAVR